MLFKGPYDTTCCTHQMAFTSSARAAWDLVLRQQLELRKGNLRLLLPAYIGQTEREGSGIYDPVRALHANCSFYRVDQNLIPDPEELTSLIASGQFDLVLIVHYFGFVQADMTSLKTMCWQHDVILVEDCAHCCFTDSIECGSVGDYSFYSLHKFLPTQTGGVLRRNHHRTPTHEFPEIPPSQRCEIGVLEQALRTDVDAVIAKRRENYLFLEQKLSSLTGIQPLWKLGANTIPHNFPVRVTGNRREKLYFYLAERDLLTTALYYRLIDEIDEATFPVSHEIANTILNLPVHQDTSLVDLELLVKEIEKFVEFAAAKFSTTRSD